MHSSLREQKQMPTEMCLVHFNVSLSSSWLILINAEPHTKKKVYYLVGLVMEKMREEETQTRRVAIQVTISHIIGIYI